MTSPAVLRVPRPWVLHLALLIAVLSLGRWTQGLAGVSFLMMAGNRWVAAFLVVGSLWEVTVLILCLRLRRGGRRVWSAVTGAFAITLVGALLLLIKSLTVMPFLSGEIDSGGTRRLVAVMFVKAFPWLFALALLTGLCCVGLFRAGSWFGVERGREWRTTLREGAWAWIAGGIVRILIPLAWMMWVAQP